MLAGFTLTGAALLALTAVGAGTATRRDRRADPPAGRERKRGVRGQTALDHPEVRPRQVLSRSIFGCHVYGSPCVLGVVTTTTGGTAVLEKVFYTSVLVSDQDKALDFYTNVLGLEKRVENPTPDGPRFLTVGVKGDDFQLVLWPGTPGQAEPAMGRPPASITIATDDCRKTVEELKRRGVEFVSDVLEFPWGYVAQFQDPDGNRLQIREGR
jgi:predicted enzyme related to lactoylglutathione lyase